MKKTLLAMAVLMAVSGTTYAATALSTGTVTVNGVEQTPQVNNGTLQIGDNGDTVSLSGGRYGVAFGSKDEPATGSVLGKTISIEGTFRSVYATWFDTKDNKTSLSLGNESTELVQIIQNGGPHDDGSAGIVVMDVGTEMSITAKRIEVLSNGDFAVNVAGLDDAKTNVAKLTLRAVDGGDINITNTNDSGIGVAVYSGGTMNVQGNLNVKAPTAIEMRGNATLNINTDGKAKTVIDGDICFGTTGNRSGKNLDSFLNLNLNGEGSSWTGNFRTDYPSDLTEEQTKVTGISLTVANGAQWNVTNVAESTTGDSVTKGLATNSLTLNNGTVNLQDVETTLKVDTLKGTGGKVLVASTTNDGASLKTAKLQAGQSSVEKLDVTLTGINADDITNANVAMESAANAVSAGDSTVTVTVQEGAVNGAITADTTGGTVSNVTKSENTKLAALNTVTAMATMAWRHDMNDLTKRMGELRDSPNGIGSWVRLYGSEQEYGRQNMTSKSTSIQMGSDYAITNEWKVGGAFTYTDGSSSYASGSADNKAYGLAIYGSWLHESGAFVDLIGKYSRLKSDFSLGSMAGTSKNNALSASAEFGWHIPVAEVAFVEPQAELTYGVVLGDDFTTSNGVKVSQDDTEALIGRLGIRGGFHFPNKKGTIYARTSVLHDFKGESEFTASLVSNPSVRSTIKDDIGGTYYEIGVGANFNLTQNAYSYVDLERQNGGDVKENWRWNVGFRYVW